MNSVKSSIQLVLLLAAFAMEQNAWAHASLQNASPPINAALSVSPKEVSLRFNEKLEAAFSSIKVFDSKGHAVTADKATVDTKDPAILRLAMPMLRPEKYTVEWVAVGHDGHRRTGSHVFAVK